MSDTDTANISRLKELALRGKEYREENEYEYFGGSMTLVVGPLEDEKLIPITGTLQAKFGMDIEDASEEIEESREEGDIDPAKLDTEFVQIMARAAVEGVDRTRGAAENLSEQEVEAVFGIANEEELAEDEENIGLRGGLTLEIAQDVLDISDDEEAAEKFRR